MYQKLLPLVVTTIEAINNCYNSDYPLIYIIGSLYRENKEVVENFANTAGYDIGKIAAQRGVFLSKNIDLYNTEISNTSHFIY